MTTSHLTPPAFSGESLRRRDSTVAKGDVVTSFIEPSMDLGQLVAEIWRHKLLVALVTILCTLVAVIVALGSPDRYRADALIQIESDGPSGMGSELLSSITGDGGPSVATEIELIRSRQVLGGAVRENDYQIAVTKLHPSLVVGAMIRLKAPWLPASSYPTSDDKLSVADLKVPADWIDLDLMITTGKNGTYTVTLPDDTVVNGQVGQALSDEYNGLVLLVDSIQSEPGKSFVVTYQSEASAIEALRDSLQLGERGRQTGLIELYLDAADGPITQRRLDSVVNSYIKMKEGYAQKKAQRSVALVEAQIGPTEAAIKSAEDALIQYQRKARTVDVMAESELLVKQINEIGLKLEREQIPRERERLLAVREMLLEQAQQLPVDQQQIANLSLELQTAQQVYVQIIKQVQETRILLASATGNVRIVDGAASSSGPVAPRRKLILVLGVAIGLFLGITLAGFRVLMRPSPVPAATYEPNA